MQKELLNYIHNMGISEAGVAKTDDGKNAVVCLFPYYIKHGGERTVSRYAVSEDYHKITAKYLEKIAEYIRNKGFFAECHADKGEPNDRKYAYGAGLGFFGKNGMLINEKYGSYTFIGYVATDMPLEAGKPLERTCLSCGKCISACPGDMKSGVCASEISQRRGELTECEKEIISKTGLIWGCDICQEVCPHNSNIEETPLKEFRENLIFSPDTDEIEAMSNREFMRKYGDRAFSWRGKGPLLRNRKIFTVIKKKV